MLLWLTLSRQSGTTALRSTECQRSLAFANHVPQTGSEVARLGCLKVLSKEVPNIVVGTLHVQRKATSREALLHPKILGVNVAGLAQATSASHTFGRRTVGVHSSLHLDAQVFTKTRGTKGDRGTFDNAVILGVARRKGDDCLGAGPGLDGVLAVH